MSALRQANITEEFDRQHLNDRAIAQRRMLARFRDRYRDDWPEGHELHPVSYVIHEMDTSLGAVALCSCGELLCVGETDYTAEEAFVGSRQLVVDTLERANSKTRNASWLVVSLLFLGILNIVNIAWIATHVCR